MSTLRGAALTAGPPLAEQARGAAGQCRLGGERKGARSPSARGRSGGGQRGLRAHTDARHCWRRGEPHWLKAVPAPPPPPVQALTLDQGRPRRRVAPPATAAAEGPPPAHPPGSLGNGPSRTPLPSLPRARAHASSPPSPRIGTRSSQTGGERVVCGPLAAEWGEGGGESAAVCHRRDRGVGSHPCDDLCVSPGRDPVFTRARPTPAGTPPTRSAVK